MSHEDDDEYVYRPVPDPISIDLQDNENIAEIHEMMEWAAQRGRKELITTREGACFTSCHWKDLWLISLYGGQPIHHDRHMSENGTPENQHTWILVCSRNQGQMLITEIAPDIFTHIPLEKGTLIYLNTTNRHLVSRLQGNEVSVMLQVQGFDDQEGMEALEAMLTEWRTFERKKAA